MDNLPIDVVGIILSYFKHEDIKKMNLPFNYYNIYLQARSNKQMNKIWYKGTYNNLYRGCFLCNTFLYNEATYMMIICMKCELLVDNYCNYVEMCLK